MRRKLDGSAKWVSRSFLICLVAFLVFLGVLFRPILTKLDYSRLFGRASWQLTERVVQALRIPRGAAVADIGAGDGYFTFPLAEAVSGEGRLFAVEVDRELTERLTEAARSKGFSNVDVVLGKPDDPLLPDGAIDLVFLCNTYHHIEDRVTYFSRLRTDLKPDGRVAIIDLRDVFMMRFLTPLGHWTDRGMMAEEMTAAGYREVEAFDFLPIQNFVMFTPRAP